MSQSNTRFLIYGREKATSGCFKNSTSIALQQCQNQVRFQRNGSGVVLNFLLIILKSRQCFVFIREHFHARQPIIGLP